MKKIITVFTLILASIPLILSQSVSNVSITGTFTEGKTVTSSYDYNPGALADPSLYFEWLGVDNLNDTTFLQTGSGEQYTIAVGDNIYRLRLKVILLNYNGTKFDTIQISHSVLYPQIIANSLPVASNASIEPLPNMNVGSVLWGSYTYSDADGDPEGSSKYTWYSDASQGGSFSISVGSGRTYTLISGDENRYFKFKVIPVAASGNTGDGTQDISDASDKVNGPPRIYPAVVTIASTITAGESLTAVYTYQDPDNDPEASIYTWYRGTEIIGGALSKTYTTTSLDGGETIKVMVTPKSSSGYPDTGTPVISNECTVNASGKPIIAAACIMGDREVGSELEGRYAGYDYPESQISGPNTIHKWIIGGVTIVDTDNKYTLLDGDENKEIIYQITPVARNGAVGDPVNSAPLVDFDMATTQFSTSDTYATLVTDPVYPLSVGYYTSDSTSVFISGDKYYFPSHKNPGAYPVTYNLNLDADEGGCRQKAFETLTLGASVIQWHADFEYCVTDGVVDISVSNVPANLGEGFSIPTNPSALVGMDLSSHAASVNIGTLGEGNKKDYIEFIYLDAATFVVYTSRWEFVIDSIGTNLSLSVLEDKMCENADPVQVNSINRYPVSGSGSWSSIPGFISESTLDYAVINASAATGGGIVDVYYTFTAGGCESIVSIPLTIYPKYKPEIDISDKCIDYEGDPIQFTNNTPYPDSCTWSWDFGPSEGTSNMFEPSHIFKTGGIKTIKLISTTNHGCIDETTVIDTIARKPLSDFRWEDDCFYAGENLLLFDESKNTESVNTIYWIIDGGDTLHVLRSDPDTLYNKTMEGIINVDYYLNTLVDGCFDVASKKVYIRPVYTIAEEDYPEDFDTPGLGWFRDTPVENTWSRGIPERFGADPLSTDTAWYTSYNIPNPNIESYSVESPCFDFRGVKRPMIKMDIMRSFDEGRDGAVLQYREGNAIEWKNIGGTSYGLEWYDNSNIYGKPGGSNSGWSPEKKDNNWVHASQYLDELAGKYDVKLRVAYGSDGTSKNNKGFAFDDIWIGERSRNVLVENFTNTSTPAVITADNLINNIVGTANKDAINIQYHTGYMAGDPFYIGNTADPSARVLYYGLSKVPYSLYDGGYSNMEWARRYDFSLISPGINDLRNRSLIDPQFFMAIDSTDPGQYRVRIKPLEDITADDVTLYIAVVASKITNPTGTNGQIQFNVLRKMLPDAGGAKMKTTWNADEDTLILSPFYINLGEPLFYDSDSVQVIAFLQNSITKKVYQAVSTGKIPTGMVTPVEKLEYFESSFDIYPNPASDILNISLGDITTNDGRIIITSFAGIEVLGRAVPAGTESVVIEGLGLPSGIYFVRLTLGGVPAGYKKLIITGR